MMNGRNSGNEPVERKNSTDVEILSVNDWAKVAFGDDSVFSMVPWLLLDSVLCDISVGVVSRVQEAIEPQAC